MGQIFNEKVVEKWSLWDPWTVIAEKSKHVVEKKKKKKKSGKKRKRGFANANPNGYLVIILCLSWPQKKKEGDIIGKVGYCVYKYMFFFFI